MAEERMKNCVDGLASAEEIRTESMECKNHDLRLEISRNIHPFMKKLFYRIAEGGGAFSMDGVWVYNDKAQFVGGKVINLCSYVVTELMEGEEQEAGLKELAEIVKRSAALPMKTWGILNAVIGLYRLERKGLRGKAASPKVWDNLKEILDWRTFVDCENHLALIDLPTNYYGVAFGIARYRELLGWDEDGDAAKLLERFLEHIGQYSGEYGFMDETQGQGRFDRYSILVPAEITNTIYNTGLERKLPARIAAMLRKSAEICLSMANENGLGFSYGRSTGAYGDTGVLEVLWAASRVTGVLNQEEEKTAYAYCTEIVKRFRTFWIDEEMQSVNLWEKGRRTDSYRNKNRILSENLSLCMQVASLYSWENPGCDRDYLKNVLSGKNKGSVTGNVTFFARDQYDRALAVVRDQSHIFMLPIISGGDAYYRNSPYLPIPYEQFFITGVPGESYADLVPGLIVESGQTVMPIVFTKDVTWKQEEDGFTVSWRQDELCVVNEQGIEAFDGITSVTEYRFKNGEIERTDTFHIESGTVVTGVRTEFLTFSEEPETANGKVMFAKGSLGEISAEGYETCVVEVLDGNSIPNGTPEGPLKCRIEWTKEVDGTQVWERRPEGKSSEEESTIRLSWKIRYWN